MIEYEKHVCECLNVYASALDCIFYTSIYVFKFHALYIMLMGLVFPDVLVVMSRPLAG